MQQKSGITPLALLNRPELDPHLQLAWDVYHVLSRSRHWTDSGPQPIACSEFYAHTSRLGIRPGGFEQTLLAQVQALDQAYLEDWVQKRKAEAEQPGTSTKSDDTPLPPLVG